MINKWFQANAIPQVEVKVPNDRFENLIRELSIGYACEWMGHDCDGHFAKEVVNALCDGTEINNPFALNSDGDYIELDV